MVCIKSIDAKTQKTVIYGWMPPMKEYAQKNQLPKLEYEWRLAEDVIAIHNSQAIPFVEALTQIKNYVKLTKETMSNKRNIDTYGMVSVTRLCL